MRVIALQICFLLTLASSAAADEDECRDAAERVQSARSYFRRRNRMRTTQQGDIRSVSNRTRAMTAVTPSLHRGKRVSEYQDTESNYRSECNEGSVIRCSEDRI
jgi:hypothetical protein